MGWGSFGYMMSIEDVGGVFILFELGIDFSCLGKKAGVVSTERMIIINL